MACWNLDFFRIRRRIRMHENYFCAPCLSLLFDSADTSSAVTVPRAMDVTILTGTRYSSSLSQIRISPVRLKIPSVLSFGWITSDVTSLKSGSRMVSLCNTSTGTAACVTVVNMHRYRFSHLQLPIPQIIEPRKNIDDLAVRDCLA